MGSWERYNETFLPPKKNFYSELILEDIIDADYLHAQKVFNEYCKYIGDYHNLYLQTDTLLLADVFKIFRDKYIEIYGLDPSYFYSAPVLAWQACLKKTDVELELLTDYQNLLMIEEGIRRRMCQSNNKYMKNYDKN